MGAHSTIRISRKRALEVWLESTGIEMPSNEFLEDFMDDLLYDRLYNCTIVSDWDDDQSNEDYLI